MDLANALRTSRARWASPDAASSPGVVLMACTLDTVVVDASGLAVVEHGIPMTTSTRVYAASLAKIVTALCVHRLAEQGRLDLDEPVARWFPRLVEGDRITVRHLLMHRSGLPEYHALRLVGGYGVDDRLDAADVLGLVDGMTTWFAPGSRVAYNNSNYAMLAHVVAATTGGTFADAVEQLVAVPAGMASLVLRDHADGVVPESATGYSGNPAHPRRSVMGVASAGDGGMWWSGNDLAALGRLLLRGGLPVEGGTDSCVRRLRQQLPLPDGTTPNLASGCVVDPAGWIGGLAEFVGFKAELRAYPAQGVAIGAMANLQGADVAGLLDAVAASLDLPPRRPPAPPAPEPGPVPDGVLVGVGGAPWRFTADGDGCRADVGGLQFRMVADGPVWTVAERPSVVAGWEGGRLVVRDGGNEIARLAAVGGVPASGDQLAGLTGWWWCPSARATLAVELVDGALVLRRGQLPSEPLLPIGDRGARWVFAAPWGLVELDHDGSSGIVVLNRAEGLALQRLSPAGGAR